MPGMTAIDHATLHTDLVNEEQHGFHEGASIRKRNGIYYLVYADISRSRPTCISYATGASPLGPFEKGGVIIDNAGCDPETWNNHGSIAEFNGNWYVFYHRSSHGSRYSRRACIDPIHFNDDGGIDEVEMTTQGVSGPLDATTTIEAYRACGLSGKVRTATTESPAFYAPNTEHLSHIHDGDWAVYKNINFGDGATSFKARVAGLAYGGIIELRLDGPDGPLIGNCEVMPTGGWQRWETAVCPVTEAAGVHPLYLTFRGGRGRLFDIESFLFER